MNDTGGTYRLKTKLISTSDAIPGMIVAEDIYGLQDYLIIPAHSKLTNHSITRLRFYAIHELLIELEETEEDVEIPAPKPVPFTEQMADTYSEFIKKTPEFEYFKESCNTAVERLKMRVELQSGKLRQPVQPDILLEDIDEILSESRNPTHIVQMIDCMRDSDDVTYKHSISCAILCKVMGQWMKYSKEDIKVLTLAGLLHDIGKLTMPSAILQKPTRLSANEYSIMKQHPQEGYKLLLDQHLDQRILNAALQHHERVDGSGYPRGLIGNAIDEMAQIVAIVDVYIAMINPRIYRPANCPFDAMSVFEQEGYQMFSPKIMLTFLEGLANSYVNSTVQLNDNRTGEIILIDSLHITRPVIKIGTEFIDLREHYNLHITDIL